MRTITRMLLASVLAIGASSFAGCNDADCPSAVSQGESCSAAGLSCTTGAMQCTCANGVWACDIDFGPEPPPRDMARHDLSLPDEGPPGD